MTTPHGHPFPTDTEGAKNRTIPGHSMVKWGQRNTKMPPALRQQPRGATQEVSAPMCSHPTAATESPQIPTTKQCTRCGIVLPFVSFHTDKRARDGRRAECKPCTSIRVEAWRKANPDRVKTYYKAYRSRHPDRVKTSNEGFRQRNREKYRAHWLVQQAVRDGRLKRPTLCQECGQFGNTEAHHEDYDRPLDVIWLCTTCHGATRKRDDSDELRVLAVQP